MRHWSARYLGVPFKLHGDTLAGCDCWGLVRLVYREELGIDVPAYAGPVSAQEAREIDLALGAGGDWPWQAVEPGKANEFDLVTIRFAKVEAHVGLIIEPGLILHVGEGIFGRTDRIGAEHWNAALGRYLRHRSLA